MDAFYSILFEMTIQKAINPFIFSAISSITGLLVMLGYITPKGQDALNSFLIFLIGATLMALSVVISHLHHAEITQINASSQNTSQPVMTTTNTPSQPSQPAS